MNFLKSLFKKETREEKILRYQKLIQLHKENKTGVNPLVDRKHLCKTGNIRLKKEVEDILFELNPEIENYLNELGRSRD